MVNTLQASRAYAASAAHRPVREQEAEVFRRANAALRRARDNRDDAAARARALADNERLWNTVVDLARDPENALPGPVRAGLVSVGLAVLREVRTQAPDIDFLIGINDDIAAGLCGNAA